MAVKTEGTGQATLDTNLSDANSTFTSGIGVTDTNTVVGAADLDASGYHIPSSSAAVGIGLAGLSAVDIDGEARPAPVGTLPDLGADEVTQAPVDTTPPTVVSITALAPARPALPASASPSPSRRP